MTFLAERCYCLLQVLKNLEEVQYSYELECLQDKFGRVEQLQRPSALFGGGEVSHEKTNAAGIDRGYLLQIQQKVNLTSIEQLSKSLAGPIHGFPQTQAATQLDDLYLRLRANFDVHLKAPPGSQKPGDATNCAHLP